MQLRAGAADVVLAVGAEKMYSDDKAKMFSCFESAWDIETLDENKSCLADMGKDIVPPPGSQSDKPYSPFMDVYSPLRLRTARRNCVAEDRGYRTCSRTAARSAAAAARPSR